MNNQIGYTTTPNKGRSAVYASDLAKCIDAPIFHVNADSLEDVHRVFKIAAKFRQTFHQDVVIDLIGYRKMGHNELDQPMFTQPLMYKQIAKMTPVNKIYEQKLIDEGTLTADEIKTMKTKINDILEDSYQKSRTLQYKSEDWVSPQWAEIMNVDIKTQILSGIPVEQVREIGKAISTLPKDD